ncbi:MAG: helix-turn-helix transcriptional regulator [Saprospiraceae bacterium]|nr:helix-turn-helix transcriptional regulator [Saprospiraceae bacterium]
MNPTLSKVLLSANLKAIRKKWRYEQKEFGELLGVSRGSMSNYENGHAIPSIDVMMTLQRLTGLNIEVISTTEIKAIDLPDQPLDKLSELPGLDAPTSGLLYFPDLVQYVQELGERVKKLEEKE